MVTATAAPGWRFLQWLGDASGTEPAVTVGMSRARCVQAVFGTALSNSVVGGGSVGRSPAAEFYSYGSAVRLTAVPGAGSYFAFWGNAGSGTNNPLAFPVTNANATVAAVFAALPVNQYALTMVAEGRGRVEASPAGNRFARGTSVTLTAAPEPGQSFLGWSGDAGGVADTNAPLAVVPMTQSRVVTARFTRRARLEVFTCGGAVDTADVPLLLHGEAGGVEVIKGSADLRQWSALATVTNTFGTAQWNDTGGAGWRFYRARTGP